ncbi:MAG: class I SAM-dependent methyltransferase [Reyranella sp.]|nr:class I SAM-dependent methyltransferase [Reyranella sp.]
MTGSSPRQFTPALGRSEFTTRYDDVIAVMVREKRLRSRLVELLAPADGDTTIDIGSGTGTVAIAVKQAAPRARILAVDPDPEVRGIAEARASMAGVTVEFVTAMGDEMFASLRTGAVDKVVSTLVLHQCPIDMKKAILRNAYRMLRPSSLLLVADYGVQPTLLTQMLFEQVRNLDGRENTRPNKEGMVPIFIAECGFEAVEELTAIPTPTGSISIRFALKPANS